MNYFFELWTVVGFLAVTEARVLADDLGSASIGSRWATPTLMAAVLLSAVATFTAGADACRLVWPSRFGAPGLALSPGHADELDRARALVGTTEGAVYCQPALSGLAWRPNLPSYQFEDYPYFHRPALQRHVLHGGGLEGLIATRHFRLIVVDPPNRIVQEAATAAGYARQPGWTHLVVLTAPPDGPTTAAAEEIRALDKVGRDGLPVTEDAEWTNETTDGRVDSRRRWRACAWFKSDVGYRFTSPGRGMPTTTSSPRWRRDGRPDCCPIATSWATTFPARSISSGPSARSSVGVACQPFTPPMPRCWSRWESCSGGGAGRG